MVLFTVMNSKAQQHDAVSIDTSRTRLGSTVAIGDEVRLNITGPCPRCVMTILPQGDLPYDPGILRTAAQHNQVNVGVYASVMRGGKIGRGDSVKIE